MAKDKTKRKKSPKSPSKRDSTSKKTKANSRSLFHYFTSVGSAAKSNEVIELEQPQIEEYLVVESVDEETVKLSKRLSVEFVDSIEGSSPNLADPVCTEDKNKSKRGCDQNDIQAIQELKDPQNRSDVSMQEDEVVLDGDECDLKKKTESEDDLERIKCSDSECFTPEKGGSKSDRVSEHEDDMNDFDTPSQERFKKSRRQKSPSIEVKCSDCSRSSATITDESGELDPQPILSSSSPYSQETVVSGLSSNEIQYDIVGDAIKDDSQEVFDLSQDSEEECLSCSFTRSSKGQKRKREELPVSVSQPLRRSSRLSNRQNEIEYNPYIADVKPMKTRNSKGKCIILSSGDESSDSSFEESAKKKKANKKKRKTSGIRSVASFFGKL